MCVGFVFKRGTISCSQSLTFFTRLPGVAKLLSGFFQRKNVSFLKGEGMFEPLNWCWKTLVRSWFFSDLRSWCAEAKSHNCLTVQPGIYNNPEWRLCKHPRLVQIYSYIHKGWLDHTCQTMDLFPSIHARRFIVSDLNACMTCIKSNLYWILSFGTKKNYLE